MESGVQDVEMQHHKGRRRRELVWYKVYRPEAGKACSRLTSTEIPAAVIMSYKIIGYFAAFLAVVRAGIVGPGATAVAVAQQPAATVIGAENYDSPRYSFGYSVADGLTGDNKRQEETRNGDVVHGSYGLIEPDGSRRVVSYAADPINGFNAVVQRDPGITVKTTAVAAAAPLAGATVRPVAVVAPSVIAAAAPAAVAVRPQAIVVGAPLLRQPFIAGSTLAAANVVAANSDLLGVNVGLGVRSRALYGAQTVVANGYGSGSIVRIH